MEYAYGIKCRQQHRVKSLNANCVKGTFKHKNGWFLATVAFKMGSLVPSARRCHFKTCKLTRATLKTAYHNTLYQMSARELHHACNLLNNSKYKSSMLWA